MHRLIVDTLLELERDGTLSPAQRVAVERRLDRALAPKDHRASFVGIVAALGAVLVAAGILYLVGYHWERLSKAVQLAVVFGVWGAVHAAGVWLTVRGRPLLGTAFTVLGVLCFGAAIGLVAQIYHLTSHYPNAVLAWWALNVPVLLWSRTRAVQLAVTGLFVVWSFWHVGVYLEGRDWAGVDEHAVAFGLLAGGLGVLCCGLGALVDGTRWQPFAALWHGLAWVGALAAPFVLAFEGIWDGLPEGVWFAAGDGWHGWRPWHGYAVALLAGLVLFVIASARGGTRTPAAVGRAAVVTGTAVVLGVGTVLAGPAMPVIGNVVLLALLVLLVRLGTQQRRPALVNTAVGVFCVVVFVRYAEYLWDKLEGAYAFLALGALLLGLGWFLERQRRRWLARAREEPG